MQATTSGPNRTGVALSPELEQAMNEAADALTPATDIDTSEMEANKLRYIAEAEAVGSVPPPISAEEASEPVGADPGPSPMFLDKLGERIAFERTGTRLYDALIVKYRASRELDGGCSRLQWPRARRAPEQPEETLARIRAEELSTSTCSCEAMRSLGGDPTAQTPCADVSAVASSGIMQVLNDPRTTLGQCLERHADGRTDRQRRLGAAGQPGRRRRGVGAGRPVSRRAQPGAGAPRHREGLADGHRLGTAAARHFPESTSERSPETGTS